MKARRLLPLTILLFIAVSLPVLGGDPPANGTLKAGFGKIDITPDIPVMLYGYASRKTLSEGVHDHLYARAAMFESNGRRVLLISSDLGSYTDTLYSVICKEISDKYKLKDTEIFLAAIHSHSSPVVSLNPDKIDRNNVIYTKSLIRKLVTVSGDALKNLKPADIAAGRGYSAAGSNRRETATDGSVKLGRNPYGVTDKEVLVLKVSDQAGKPVGAVFDYATHATSLGPSNMLVSGDVLGLSEQFVEQYLGEGFVAPVFAGASGNIDPWYRILPAFKTKNGWIPEPVLLGTLLGEEVVHAMNDAGKSEGAVEIASSSETILCPRKSEDVADEELPWLDKQGTIPVKITAARIGDDVAFIGFNVEMLTEIGMAIKQASPFKHTFIITHCNGSSGYLPPSELYKEGGYEISSTHFAIGSDKIVISNALRMLYGLK